MALTGITVGQFTPGALSRKDLSSGDTSTVGEIRQLFTPPQQTTQGVIAFSPAFAEKARQAGIPTVTQGGLTFVRNDTPLPLPRIPDKNNTSFLGSGLTSLLLLGGVAWLLAQS